MIVSLDIRSDVVYNGVVYETEQVGAIAHFLEGKA